MALRANDRVWLAAGTGSGVLVLRLVSGDGVVEAIATGALAALIVTLLAIVLQRRR